MPKIRLDDKVYEITSLSSRVEELTNQLKSIDAKLEDSKSLHTVLMKAKEAFQTELKVEILSTKAGFDFSE